MLVYLDNAQSFGPSSMAGQKPQARPQRKPGARDPRVAHAGRRRRLHAGRRDVPGAHPHRLDVRRSRGAHRRARYSSPSFPTVTSRATTRLLGKVYKAGGIEQGEAALADLARHPATARHIARKLAAPFRRRRAAAKPRRSARAKVFRRPDGDLKAMALALARRRTKPGARERAKIRSPQQFLMAAVRAIDRMPEDPGLLLGPLNVMGMPLWQPPGPNGWPDTVSAWASPKGMKSRLDISAAIAARVKDLVNPAELLETIARRGRIARDAPGRDARRIAPAGTGAAAHVARVSMEIDRMSHCCEMHVSLAPRAAGHGRRHVRLGLSAQAWRAPPAPAIRAWW